MPTQLLDRLGNAIQRGDVEACAALTSPAWTDPVDRPTEPTPTVLWRQIGTQLFAAFSDREIRFEGLVEHDGEVRGRVHASFRYTGDLWGWPPNGNRVSVEAGITARLDGEGRLQWWLTEWNPIATLRAAGAFPMPEFMDRPMAFPIVIPEEVLKWAFNGGFLEKTCTHRHLAVVTDTTEPRCKVCDDLGVEYPAARMCMVCGHVGCCDTAKNKHARKHYEETGHPLMRSVRLSETWAWCYVDGCLYSQWW